MYFPLISALSVIPIVLASGPLPGSIKNLVTFGDSYTDISGVGDNGTAWPVYAAGYGGFNLHSFAISGATCDKRLTPRITYPFPYLVQNEIPNYLNATSNGLELPPHETLYTLWIGTNDVGADTMLTGQQTPGTTIVQVTACAVNWIKTMYSHGARNFLFQNMLPLNLAILYQANGYPTNFWTAPRNSTEWNIYITELVAAGNEIASLMLEKLPASLPGAHIGLFDSHSLFQDIYDHPELYLNGTAPYNVTGCINSCPANQPCTVAEGTDRDSFLWFNELHPSEQANRVLARQITNVITRQSERWTTWYS